MNRLASIARRWRPSLGLKLAGLLLGVFSAGAATGIALWQRWPEPGLTALLVILLGVLPCLLLAGRATRRIRRMLRALEGAVASYRDGDFSISTTDHGGDELSALVARHNELGRTLREQRQHLVQRELLLDTVVQNTPVALVLTDSANRVAYANMAARQLFNAGKRLGVWWAKPWPRGRTRCSVWNWRVGRRPFISPSAGSGSRGGRIACTCSDG